jgi:predicted dienelactone hydrolase
MSDDQRFVLASLDTLQSNDPVFGGHLDLERIGLVGMSSGGTAGHITCAIDARCRAGLNMDGFQAVLLDVPPLTVPFMHMSNGSFYSHNIPHEQSTSVSYVVRVNGSAHGSYTDAGFTTPSFKQLDKLGIAVVGTIDGGRMLQVMNAYALAFFNKHLKGEDQPLLNASSERYPEVEFLFHAERRAGF